MSELVCSNIDPSLNGIFINLSGIYGNNELLINIGKSFASFNFSYNYNSDSSYNIFGVNPVDSYQYNDNTYQRIVFYEANKSNIFNNYIFSYLKENDLTYTVYTKTSSGENNTNYEKNTYTLTKNNTIPPTTWTVTTSPSTNLSYTALLQPQTTPSQLIFTIKNNTGSNTNLYNFAPLIIGSSDLIHTILFPTDKASNPYVGACLFSSVIN